MGRERKGMVKVAEFGMKRREEIEKAAHQKYPYEGGTLGMICERSIPIFIQGAEWADKTMVEKACKWITEHIDIPYEGEFIDDSPVASDYIEWCEKRLEYAKAVADAFKQAMEE